MTFIFSGIVLVACLLLLGTCSWIFRSVESTVKNIRYDDILSGYKTEVKAEVETALSIVQHYYGLSQSGKITEDQAKSDAEEALSKAIEEENYEQASRLRDEIKRREQEEENTIA